MKHPKYYKIKIEEFFKGIKWKFQRAHRGYSDCDLWSINYWFLDTFPRMLRDFSKGLHSSPCNTTSGEWEDIIERMAITLERSSPYYWTNQLPDDYSSDQLVECFKKAEKHWNMFIDMFKEYFYDLWD